MKFHFQASRFQQFLGEHSPRDPIMACAFGTCFIAPLLPPPPPPSKKFLATALLCNGYNVILTICLLQAGEKHYHPQCSRCARCHGVFGEGQEMFLQGKDMPQGVSTIPFCIVLIQIKALFALIHFITVSE